ncbi:Hypothetical predicted protein, partial [Mytilus galloprovincialis]
KEMDDYCEVFEFLRNGNASDESIQTIGEEKVKSRSNGCDVDIITLIGVTVSSPVSIIVPGHVETKGVNIPSTELEDLLKSPLYGKSSKGNDNAKKQERKIEIGWFDYDYRSSEYRQVRTLNGGGVRYINAPKTWMQDDILQHGKKVFFLNGKSKRGNVTDFQFEVRNFMGGRMDNDCTIGDLYTLTGSKLLRFYIYSKKLPTTAVGCSEMESPSDDSLPDHKLLQVK